MKKTFFASLCILATFCSYAQFDLGIKGGVNFNQLYTDAGSFKANFNQSLDTKSGYVFGVYTILGKKLLLQPEAVVAFRRGNVRVIPVGGGTPFEVEAKTTHLDVPVLIGYKILGKRLRISLGPVASFKLTEDNALKDQLEEISKEPGDAFSKSSFGYQAGIGFKILGFQIDLRKDGSLHSISSKTFSGENFSQRMSGWQITLGKNIL
ncbi:MAG: outer membrane beta-barrel protein [Leadbetterella sp.]